MGVLYRRACTTPELTDVLPLELRRKLAVWAATGGWLGIGRWPSAMPTMAVMWVSVPKTWMGIPVVLPEGEKQMGNKTPLLMNKNKQEILGSVSTTYQLLPSLADPPDSWGHRAGQIW